MGELLKLAQAKGWELKLSKEENEGADILWCKFCNKKQTETPFFYCPDNTKVICIDCEEKESRGCKSLKIEHEHFRIEELGLRE
jgi:hypothetical protein|tara:strand:+ start:437 stop:688 length:252 start_codon:yes stop_codon:yes gene_type:complete